MQRPVSIHVVGAWGELLDSLTSVRDEMTRRHRHAMDIDDARGMEDDDGRRDGEKSIVPMSNEGRRRTKAKRRWRGRYLLPPKIYFHSFSGKAGMIPLLLAACERGNVRRGTSISDSRR